MKTIHIILNAHIDPVWLWAWQSGLGEVQATCRSACDRLDNNPDIFFTRGEAWVYEQIEKIDPELFERIRGHVKSGRWEIVGGWYIQPDCNLPSHWAMEKQIGIGKAYFEEKFGIFPKVGYNVDSFGHAAALPGLMRSFGQDYYIATRPDKNELTIPARIMRWRGYEDGPEVLFCRPHFCSHEPELNLTNLTKALEDLPEGCDHTACFVGVGDHGGGPTEAQIAWIRRHGNDVEGVRIEFSSLQRFFAAIRPLAAHLPLFVGELQHHAIGCYSAYRPVKTNVRRVEHLLAQAENLGQWDAETRAALDKAWKYVCFHHFHDTLGGACVPSAYISVLDQLGAAAATADEALQYDLRRKITTMPGDPYQQMVFHNTSGQVFDDYVEYEPWVGPWANRWVQNNLVIDEAGEPIEFQLLDSESILFSSRNDTVLPRMLYRVRVEPGAVKVLRIKRVASLPHIPSRVSVEAERAITNRTGVRCEGDRITWREAEGRKPYTLPFHLELIRDMTDTWSHGVDRFDGPVLDVSTWGDPAIIDKGPLMASLATESKVGQSPVHAEWRVYADESYADLTLRVHWQERFRILKLVLPFRSAIDSRTDGVMGTSLVRLNNGTERPLRDWTLLTGEANQKLGVVCPDVYGIDATNERVCLTLLRSPLMAHHEPAQLRVPRENLADQGVHTFHLRFFYGPDVSTETLEHHTIMLQRPLTIQDSTRGMPTVIPGSEGLLQD